MQTVKILQDVPFADYSAPPKIGVKRYEVGAEVQFPDEYAEYCMEAGLVEPVYENRPEVEKPTTLPEPVLFDAEAFLEKHTTVNAVMEQELEVEQWRAVLQEEQAKKNRRSLIDFIQNKLED